LSAFSEFRRSAPKEDRKAEQEHADRGDQHHHEPAFRPGRQRAQRE